MMVSPIAAIKKVALIVFAPLVVFGCAAQEYTQSITYEYRDDKDRSTAEWKAERDMHDSCFFSGAQYPQLVGPPHIVSEGGGSGYRFRATQAFYCVGANSDS